MAKLKKVLAVVLSVLFLLSVCFIVAGCKDKKYDVAIKLCYCEVQDGFRVAPVLGEIIFDKDTDELYIEREYDGKEYDYYFYAYENPLYKGKDIIGVHQWISWSRSSHSSLWREGDPKEKLCKTVCERGNYCLTIYAFSHPEAEEVYEKWNSRILRLYISVV
ncbi:MAG: hypothetical protein J1G02_01305 [Clostridiales bacterium]|nr:hypothetical protein [Clostridiales bacterium]